MNIDRFKNTSKLDIGTHRPDIRRHHRHRRQFRSSLNDPHGGKTRPQPQLHRI